MQKNMFFPKSLNLTAIEKSILNQLRYFGWAKISWDHLFDEIPFDSLLFQSIKNDFKPLIKARNNLFSIDCPSEAQYYISSRDIYSTMPSGNLLQLAFMPSISRIVISYLANSFLYDAEYWLHFKSNSTVKTSAQLWHRDPEAKKMLKIFLLMHDVDSSQGPTEIISHSHKTSPNKVLSKFQSSKIHISNLDIDKLKNKTELSFEFMTGTTGTIIFLDTSAIHRGGFCENDRLVSYMCFLPKSLFCEHKYPSWIRL